jgi:hypothetical protein
MGQRIQTSRQTWRRTWHNDSGEKAWLSMLVDTMDEVARPERRAEPCDDRLLAGLRAQLALPAQGSFAQASFASRFSLRN